MKKVYLFLVSIPLILGMVGCKNTIKPDGDYLSDTNPEVTIIFQDSSEMTLQLFPEVAPNTVKNFLSLASSDFYDGVIFHRVIEDFMIQGGDPEGTGYGGANYNIVGEFISNGIQNELSHTRGVISMARSNNMNSASSQFFIVHEDSEKLDGLYAAFGLLTDGYDVLDRIAKVDTDGSDKPIEDIIIKDIIVKDNGFDYSDLLTLSNTFNGPLEYQKDTNPIVEIVMEDGKLIQIELFPGVAPITVENFLDLIDENFYDGIIFHRVIKDFMIQGGDPQGTGMGGSTNKIKGEFKLNGVDNSLSHTRGVISMARSNDLNSASSQFFIVHQDSKFLNESYAAFGYVIAGMEFVDEIANAETNSSDKPIVDQIIKTIRLID